jgi:hypothetical protein
LIVGYLPDGNNSQAFLSFNISRIPEDAVIKSAAIDMRRNTLIGDPFLNLGCMRAYHVSYGALGPECYYAGLPLGEVLKICSPDDLGNAQNSYPELASALQRDLGLSRFQLRLQFEDAPKFFAVTSLSDIGRKDLSDDRINAGGDGGEWKPCLPEETKNQGSSARQTKTIDRVQFSSIRLKVSYLPPEQEE